MAPCGARSIISALDHIGVRSYRRVSWAGLSGHRELKPAKVRGTGRTYMHIIPQSWSHLHILVSVFPSFGLLFVLGFYLSGLCAANKGLIRTCLVFFIGLALLALPTYLSGIRAVEAFSAATKLAKDTISFHYQWGMTSIVVLILTGVIAAFELWRSYSTDVSSKVNAPPGARPRGRLARIDGLRRRLGDQSQRIAGDRRHSRCVDTAVVAARAHDHQPFPDGGIRVRRRVPSDRPRDEKRSDDARQPRAVRDLCGSSAFRPMSPAPPPCGR